MTEPEDLREYVRNLFHEPEDEQQHPIPQPDQDNEYDYEYRQIARQLFTITDD